LIDGLIFAFFEEFGSWEAGTVGFGMRRLIDPDGDGLA
jgi:hypothetical protein